MPASIAKAFYWPTITAMAMLAGGITGFSIASSFKQTERDWQTAGNDYEGDRTAALAKYEQVKGKGSLETSLSPDEMILASYAKFGEEEHTWTQGVGISKAAGLVDQMIQSTTVRDGERFFEESNSDSSMVHIYDRMYQFGGNTTTYWGEKPDYANHKPVSYSNEEYTTLMGRTVSDPLIYNVSAASLVNDENPASKCPKTGIYPEGGGYRIEAELSPVYGTIRYKCQMATISDLASKPVFDYCHITVTVDGELNLIKMVTHESYYAAVKAGGMSVGSTAIGTLTTVYHHQAPDFGFPDVGGAVAPYPSSL